MQERKYMPVLQIQLTYLTSASTLFSHQPV